MSDKFLAYIIVFGVMIIIFVSVFGFPVSLPHPQEYTYPDEIPKYTYSDEMPMHPETHALTEENNTAIGYNAMVSNSTGENNTIIPLADEDKEAK